MLHAHCLQVRVHRPKLQVRRLRCLLQLVPSFFGNLFFEPAPLTYSHSFSFVGSSRRSLWWRCYCRRWVGCFLRPVLVVGRLPLSYETRPDLPHGSCGHVLHCVERGVECDVELGAHQSGLSTQNERHVPPALRRFAQIHSRS